MFYELYIDVFFLVNFMMDYIILLVTGKILKCPATHGRICIGAAAGALFTCAVIVLPVSNAFVKTILFHSFANVVMVKIGLKIKWDRTFLRALLLLYVSGFLVGGVFEYLHQYIRTGSLFLALAIISYYITLGIWNLISYMARVRNTRCETVLYKDGRQCRVRAIIDTGNSLRDGVTGKPVSIVDKGIAEELCGVEQPEGIRYIAYHSIGKEQGVLKVMTLDGITVYQDREKWLEKPLVALSETKIAEDDTYQMVLNPDLL